MPIEAHNVYERPTETASPGSVTTRDAPGPSRPTRSAIECAWPSEPLRPVDATGTSEADAQMAESSALPAFAITKTTETRVVGGRTEVEPAGGSCIVVVVDVDVVVVDVDVVVGRAVAPGNVVVVVEDVVVLVVVGGAVVVGGSP